MVVGTAAEGEAPRGGGELNYAEWGKLYQVLGLDPKADPLASLEEFRSAERRLRLKQGGGVIIAARLPEDTATLRNA